MKEKAMGKEEHARRKIYYQINFSSKFSIWTCLLVSACVCDQHNIHFPKSTFLVQQYPISQT